MNRVKLALAVAGLLGCICGCSKEAVRSSLYEAARFQSNEVNAADPNYRPDSIPEYGEYRVQRERYLEKAKEGDGYESGHETGGD